MATKKQKDKMQRALRSIRSKSIEIAHAQNYGADMAEAVRKLTPTERKIEDARHTGYCDGIRAGEERMAMQIKDMGRKLDNKQDFIRLAQQVGQLCQANANLGESLCRILIDTNY